MPNASPVAFKDALRFWWKLGWISFGGPAGQISIMHREIVERRRWLDEEHFLHALNFSMLLPGPEAQQLATYLGWRLHGVRGGFAAGGLFILPAVFILMGLSWVYMAFGNVPAIQGILHGLEPAVIAVVAAAVLKIGGKTLRSPALWAIAAFAFIGIFFFKISFVLILLGAAAIGFLGSRIAPGQFPSKGLTRPRYDEPDKPAIELPPVPRPRWTRNVKVIALGLACWWLPLLVLGFVLGWADVHFQLGLFFSKVAMVTFGGAYAVLPYVTQHAVDSRAWLTDGQMLAGLGLAESTPGPLVIVLEFVGFVGGWQHPPAGIARGISAVAGALVTVWATFAPSFLFIFLGGPYVDGLRNRRGVAKALSAITAAVVGVILNLAVVFTIVALHPAAGEWDYFTAVLAVAGFVALTRFKIELIPVLLTCAAAGWAWNFIR